MKRTWPVLLGLLLLASPAAQAQFNYYTNKGAVILTGYEPTDTLLEASAVVISNFVTIIEMGALEGLDMTRVTIPGSVTNIGAEAFAGDALLSAVFFSGNAPTFGANVFLDCGVFVSGGVTLYYVPGTTGWGTLTSVTIPGSVTNIGYTAFDQCHGLTSVTIPGSVTSIGDRCVRGLHRPDQSHDRQRRHQHRGMVRSMSCAGLTSVTIPGSVTTIGNGVTAFGTGCLACRPIILGSMSPMRPI
jgi:hypothetical protein